MPARPRLIPLIGALILVFAADVSLACRDFPNYSAPAAPPRPGQAGATPAAADRVAAVPLPVTNGTLSFASGTGGRCFLERTLVLPPPAKSVIQFVTRQCAEGEEAGTIAREEVRTAVTGAR